eukprot:363084-Chlamydomonas_euryale.AAC.2
MAAQALLWALGLLASGPLGLWAAESVVGTGYSDSRLVRLAREAFIVASSSCQSVLQPAKRTICHADAQVLIARSTPQERVVVQASREWHARPALAVHLCCPAAASLPWGAARAGLGPSTCRAPRCPRTGRSRRLLAEPALAGRLAAACLAAP